MFCLLEQDRLVESWPLISSDNLTLPSFPLSLLARSRFTNVFLNWHRYDSKRWNGFLFLWNMGSQRHCSMVLIDFCVAWRSPLRNESIKGSGCALPFKKGYPSKERPVTELRDLYWCCNAHYRQRSVVLEFGGTWANRCWQNARDCTSIWFCLGCGLNAPIAYYILLIARIRQISHVYSVYSAQTSLT